VFDLSKVLENYAKHNYERLRVLQPHLETYGLFKSESKYYIYCEDIDIKAFGETERTLVEVFNNEIRTAGCPLQLVTSIPDGAIQIEERTIVDIITLVGDPLNIIDFNKQLSLLIPSNFPEMWVEFNFGIQGWSILTEVILTQEEQEVITEKIEILSGTAPRIEFKLDTNVKRHFPKETHDPLSIAVSRHSTYGFSKEFMDKWERDEQLWSDNKHSLFTTLEEDEENTKTKKDTSTCLINGQIGEAHNIRNYLTMFGELQIVMPIESSYEQFLKSLDVTEIELLKLLEINKVKLIFPYSVQRYSKSLLENAVHVNPTSIMLSRELTNKTIIDLKQRNPLVFLPATIQEKQEILSNLISLSQEVKESFERDWLMGLTLELSNTWGFMYQLLAIRGAVGTFNIGLGPIINSMIKKTSGNDYFIEIMQASNSIEWAAANNAVLCPIGPLAKNEERLAYLYSGIREGWRMELETSPNIATGEILTIAQYVPVIELAQTFTGSEIQRFRKLIVDVTNNRSAEEIQTIIQGFNESVKSYEKNRKRTESWDMKGVTLDAGLEVANSAIPFAGFVTKQLGRIIGHYGDRYNRVGNVVNQVQSKIYRTSPNVILVSKMRDKIKDLL
jgi:hypothetical protein